MAAFKHIVFLSPGFPHDESETNCLTYFQHYLLAFQSAFPKIRMTILSFHYPYLPDVYKWNGIEVIAFGGNNGPIWQKLRLWAKVNRKLRDLHKERPIDMLHALWLKECSWVGYRAEKKWDIPLLCTAMGTEVFSHNRYLKVLPIKKLNLITVSPFQQTKLVETVGALSKAKTISWGLPDLGSEKLPGGNDRPYHIMSVGFLNEIKQIPLFLEIVASCKQQIPGFKALLIGRDYTYGTFDKKIEELGLQDHIIKFPLLSNEEVIRLMGQSKVLVHTSGFESLGFVFLEALRSGMAIVSRQVGVAPIGSQWYIASDRVTFSQRVIEALKNYEPQPQLPFPISETVNQYMASYEMAIRHQKA